MWQKPETGMNLGILGKNLGRHDENVSTLIITNIFMKGMPLGLVLRV